MNSLIKKTFLFISICLIVILIAIIALNQFNNIFHDKLSPYRIQIKKTKVLVTGTSHSLWGINPKSLGISAINIGEVNKPINIDLAILKNNIDANKDLKLVIIPIDYFTLFFDGTNKGENFEKQYYYHWGIKNHHDIIDNYFGHFFTCGSDVIKNLLSGKYTSASGFTPKKEDFSIVTIEKQRASIAKRLSDWNKKFIDSSKHAIITNELIETILLLKSRGIECYLITMPVYSEMKKAYNKELVSIMNSEIKRIEGSTNAKYEDFNNLPIFKDASLFRDGDHLNIKGSKAMTEILKSRIQDFFHTK